MVSRSDTEVMVTQTDTNYGNTEW